MTPPHPLRCSIPGCLGFRNASGKCPAHEASLVRTPESREAARERDKVFRSYRGEQPTRREQVAGRGR